MSQIMSQMMTNRV